METDCFSDSADSNFVNEIISRSMSGAVVMTLHAHTNTEASLRELHAACSCATQFCTMYAEMG
jgi:hypothetical protein